MPKVRLIAFMIVLCCGIVHGEKEWWKPYSAPCTERENVFEFTEKPKVRKIAEDKYEIAFAVKGYCDVTVAIIDPDPKKELVPGRGIVVRHLGAGVLGPNAPAPFQKNSLKQTIYWDGKDDLGVYHKEPQNLKVRVSLGLKPVFDKRLGGTSPKNLPGGVWGLAVDEDGVYVFTRGTIGSHIVRCRKFDHNGKYIATLMPPNAKLSEKKLAGMGYIEYEPGKRAIHGTFIKHTLTQDGWYMPDGNGTAEIGGVVDCQVAVSRGRLFFTNAGPQYYFRGNSYLHYIYTDGSTDVKGMFGRIFCSFKEGRKYKDINTHCYPRMATSPDGNTLYMIGLGASSQGGHRQNAPVVVKCSTDGEDTAKVFVGDMDFPGSDEKHLNFPTGIACDSAGRVYVADSLNNRVQIFDEKGKFLKGISILKPTWVGVCHKTGAVYIVHGTVVEGKTIGRITKFSPFPELKKEYAHDGFAPAVAVVDPFAPRTRLWMGGQEDRVKLSQATAHGASITIWEDTGKELVKISDFEQEAKEEDKNNYVGQWKGGTSKSNMVACDPIRELAYVGFVGNFVQIFDMRTGLPAGRLRCGGIYSLAEAAFDRRGYMHVYSPTTFDGQDGVFRLNPAYASIDDKSKDFVYPEIPYDYGEEYDGLGRTKWEGVLNLHRPDYRLWSWGFGVNMQGDVAVCVQVTFAPKIEEEAYEEGFEGVRERQKMGFWTGAWVGYEAWIRSIEEQKKKGQRIVYIPRHPGLPFVGGTIWTFNRSGEKREEMAVISGRYNNGVQIDEDGNLYFTHAKPRNIEGRTFLEGRAGHFGVVKGESLSQGAICTFTGTYMKTRGRKVRFIYRNAKIPVDKFPPRPPDLKHPYYEHETDVWVEGAEWLYAGASPIVPGACKCPQMRAHLDWYKRSYVPESYRHSFAVLDTAGNLILHVGEYGNFDNVPPGNSVVGNGIAFQHLEYISGTDNYLCISDSGERIIVIRLDYHKEEISNISVPDAQ